MRPIISAIVPTYNHAHYLPQALVSILAQTFSGWEAIVVDDGSTDDAESVVAQFTDPRLRYIYQENQGLSAARNTGIRAAHGAYLAFLDADDEWDPEFMQRGLEVLAADHSLAGVYSRNLFIDQQGNTLPQIGGQVVPPANLHDRLLDGGFFPPNAALVRASVVRKVGLFDTQLTSVEDRDLWLRITARHPMRGIAEPLARYRVYPGSMSTDAPRMLANRIAVITKQLGPPKGDPAAWPPRKRRALGLVYRSAAFDYIQQHQDDLGWEYLAQAASIWPNLLARSDTFYELACGDQPRGYRGQAQLLDIERNGEEMISRLDALFQAQPALAARRRTAYSNAHLALGILSDQAGRWPQARAHLFRAVEANPGLLTDLAVSRRLLKLCAGQKLVHVGRRLLARSPHTSRQPALPSWH